MGYLPARVSQKPDSQLSSARQDFPIRCFLVAPASRLRSCGGRATGPRRGLALTWVELVTRARIQSLAMLRRKAIVGEWFGCLCLVIVFSLAYVVSCFDHGQSSPGQLLAL